MLRFLPPRRALCAALLLALGNGPAVSDEAAPEGLSVSVRSARRMCFRDRVEVTGVLVPRQEVDVPVEREGFKVAQILVEPLAKVTAGQALANLVPIEGGAATGGGPVLRAKVAGTLLRSTVQVGMPVSPRQGALFQIAALGEADLQAEVPLADLAKLSLGQSVTVQALGLPEGTGTVRRIDLTLDPASQLGRVRIAIVAGLDLRFGTFARGVVSLRERCNLGIPYAAVLYEADGTVVHVIAGDRVVTRQVEIGFLSGGDVEILSGLTEADSVVARAGAFLREGDQVHPIPVREAAEIRDMPPPR